MGGEYYNHNELTPNDQFLVSLLNLTVESAELLTTQRGLNFTAVSLPEPANGTTPDYKSIYVVHRDGLVIAARFASIVAPFNCQLPDIGTQNAVFLAALL